MQLEEIRAEINQLDLKLVPLLEERFKLVDKIAEFKQKNNYQIFDKKREEEILQFVKNKISDKKLMNAVLKSFQALMDVAKQYQT